MLRPAAWNRASNPDTLVASTLYNTPSMHHDSCQQPTSLSLWCEVCFRVCLVGGCGVLSLLFSMILRFRWIIILSRRQSTRYAAKESTLERKQRRFCGHLWRNSQRLNPCCCSRCSNRLIYNRQQLAQLAYGIESEVQRRRRRPRQIPSQILQEFQKHCESL
jgi:hypothetical protein